MNDSTWTWISGANTHNHAGIYGRTGIANGENIPRARRNAVGWYDKSRQEFWLFGGDIYNPNSRACLYKSKF